MAQKSIQTKVECEIAPLIDSLLLNEKLQRRVGLQKSVWALIDYLWHAELRTLVFEGGIRAFDTSLEAEIYILAEFEAFLTAEIIEELRKPKATNSTFEKLTTTSSYLDLVSLIDYLLDDSISIRDLATYKDLAHILASHRLMYLDILPQSLRNLTKGVLGAAARNWAAAKFSRCGLNYDEIESAARLGFLKQTGKGEDNKKNKEEATGEIGGIGCRTHPSPFLGAWFSNLTDPSPRVESLCPRLTALSRGPPSSVCLDTFSIKGGVPEWVPIFHPKRWPRSIPKSPSSQCSKQLAADNTWDWQGLKDARENIIRVHRYCVRSTLHEAIDRQGKRSLQLGVMELLQNQKEEGFCFGG